MSAATDAAVQAYIRDSVAAHLAAEAPAARANAMDPPGVGEVRICRDCWTRGCDNCGGRGMILVRLCPVCLADDWRYVNGYSDELGMKCLCGFAWQADLPGWVNQVLPRGVALGHRDFDGQGNPLR
jgi:hypothetical protein